MGVYIPNMKSEQFYDLCKEHGLEIIAVPVPPHGRLIDADALADVFRGFIAMYDSCPFSQLSLPDKSRRDELQSSLAEVINAPTIIPASGAENSFPAEPSEEQREYEAAVEATQYCEMYEPSYDPETGAL